MKTRFRIALIRLLWISTLAILGEAKAVNGCSPGPYASCVNANLAGADLRKANLVGADLRGANLAGANLKAAKLAGALLKQANLSGANLAKANLTGAALQFTSFQGASLVRAVLKSSDLYHANLLGADLRRADLFAANLTGANLSGANTTAANFSQVVTNGSAQYPDDLSPTVSVGEKGPAGGLIFYVAPGGHHGLEAALAPQYAASWGCPAISVPDTLTEIGTGAANTRRILAACPDSTSAAQVASSYAQNGFRDWYLASKDEMGLLMPFVEQFQISYWTSSQAAPLTAWAWYWNSFATGTGPNQLTYSQSFQSSKSGLPWIGAAPSPVTGVVPIRNF